MKFKTVFLLLFTVTYIVLCAQTNGLTTAQRQAVGKLVAAAKADDQQQLAALVRYPLKRIYPLEDIKNKTEMLSRFDEVFDGELLQQIAGAKTTDWSDMGWRGIMLGNGTLWMDDDGKITAVNYQPAKERVLLVMAIQKDKQGLPSSLQQLTKPLYRITTKHYRIRIDELEADTLRYASWNLNSRKKEPDLVLYNGVFEAQGSGGNHTITFTNNGYQYAVSINRLGTKETPEVLLTVSKNGKSLLKDPGKLIRN
ncbi:hypothetical protein [Niabella beijingensis]|uniref:hypothetical protein n=1 Tax=Niabella beijingensis TaxID=2872700 RepID=UPI001CBDA5EE|nr:hypothetical protein [Niabella beijingensis]MBZ4188074.1 hypothetical protein [Niabella beijingensis]